MAQMYFKMCLVIPFTSFRTNRDYIQAFVGTW